ncbi:DUF3108 domain-containing protein [Stakelama sp. CBK3Z-3]|uniref:DUF3108 domain-containing protein n=1 Tax=Stakelama flava TaxID=2860338 RepID=A0ABS6XL02_9SPHN|nr:DUF3108 domain-containing protein [Stakelama flava]MBW4330865.1 DUF3108 domain-containing protein [Stakelama flava]
MLAAFLIALLGAQTNASIPVVNGAGIGPLEQCFAMQRGGKTIGATLQTIRAVEENGVPAWDVVVHQRVGDGSRFDMRDHFVLQKRDLRPIRFDSAAVRGDQRQHVELVYGTDHVTGKRVVGDTSTPIDVTLSGPVWEGDLWGVMFGALPLREGGSYRLPFFQYDKGLGEFELNVSGSETVETPAGSVAVWTVDVTTGDGPPATYLISKQGGAEMGYRAQGFANVLGGDCSGLS